MKSNLPSIIAIILLAILANIAWLFEIVQLIGWEGSYWLQATHYSVYFINLLVVIAYLTPVYLIKKTDWQKLLYTAIELYAVAIVAYLISKSVLYTMYGGIYAFLNFYSTLGILFLIPIMTGVSYFLVTKRQLYPLSWRSAIPLSLAMLLPIFLSWLTMQVLPGFDRISVSIGSPNVIKMGYPFFWITLLMGMASLINLHYFQKTTSRPTQPDLLDDLPFRRKGE